MEDEQHKPQKLDYEPVKPAPPSEHWWTTRPFGLLSAVCFLGFAAGCFLVVPTAGGGPQAAYEVHSRSKLLVDLALASSIVGAMVDERREWAIAMMIVTGLLWLPW